MVAVYDGGSGWRERSSLGNSPRLVRLSDTCPTIGNCRGGIDGDKLLGAITVAEVNRVKSLPVAPEPRDQQAMEKTQRCSTLGTEVEIAYFPKVRLGEELAFPVVAALCLNTNCEFNTSK